MQVLLDLIGSVVIAAFVILMGLRLNQTIGGSADAAKANLIVQESVVDIVRSLDYDFRKIGYDVPDPENAIVIADSNHIEFRADMVDAAGNPRPDGNVDVIDWFLTDPIGGFPNKAIRILYRQVNHGQPVGAALGVTQFKLKYLTQDGDSAAFKSEIAIIEMTLKVESPYKVQDAVVTDQSYEDMGYAASFWRQTRLVSRNIRRHG